MAKVTEVTAQLAEPIVAAAGCTLWDVEYIKEAGEWFLRVYIDKAGGVSIRGRPGPEAAGALCRLSGAGGPGAALPPPGGTEGVCGDSVQL